MTKSEKEKCNLKLKKMVEAYKNKGINNFGVIRSVEVVRKNKKKKTK